MTARLRLLAPSEHASAPREAAAAGSEPAMDQIERAYAEHHEWVFYLAMRYGAGDRAWAEDIMQDVFIRLLRQLERGVAIQNLRGWLHRATTNRCLSRLERDRFLEAPPIRFLLGTRVRRPATPEELGIVDDELRAVADVLRQASAKERTCFYLHHLDKLSMREIGETVGLSKGYVCKLIARVEARIEKARRKRGD